MDMMYMVWLVLVMGYGFFKRAAGDFSQAVLCFLDGGYLAFLCFAILPSAMGTNHFFMAAAAAGAGVVMSFLTEKYRILPVAVFALVVFAFLFRQESFSQSEVLLFSFCGGMGLYHASAGIIPEQIAIGKALMSGAGFLCGTLLFGCF